MHSMFAKLVVLVLLVTAVGCVLLGLRQQRLYLANELATVHHQIREDQQAMWRDQSEIARHASPEQMRQVMRQIAATFRPAGSLQPWSRPYPVQDMQIVEATDANR